MFRKIVAAGAIVALIAVPASADSHMVRDSAPVEEANSLGGESNLYFLLGIAITVAAIVFLAEDDDPISA